MAKILGFNIPQQFFVGFIAGIFSTILVWLVSLVEGLAASLIALLQQGRAAGLVTGTDLGTKLVQMLGGKWALGLPDMLIGGIGGGILVMAGTWIYSMKWSPNAIPGFKETPITKLTLVLFYASILATLVLTAFAIPTIPALLVLLINSIVTAWFVIGVLRKQLNLA